MATNNSTPLLFFLSFLLTTLGNASTSGGGSWLLLRSSIGISAMHMQLLPSNHVVIFDRTGSGPSNLSLPLSSCSSHNNNTNSTDCTAHSVILHLPSLSLRPLSFLSDPWCSSATLLPNSSFLQSGGFNRGDRTIRILTDPTSDWLELPDALSVRRWYATNQLLPDGTVLILGGRKQFNYEFFPKRYHQDHNDLFPFPFLEQTRDGDAENNLYPFLHLLPDGNLFVFANTRSVILNPTRNQIVHELPKIPDSVPRSYPSSGSSVLLPLVPDPDNPAATRAEVLICGGAAFGNFQAALNGSFLRASRTCGRMTVTDAEHAGWAMEDMPMPRVMGDMVILPTGEILIVNGAGAGTAGWELAVDPVTAPLLYRPRSPASERFVVLNSSPVPRMYHSTAILDPSGRVLIGGSNPHVTYTFTNVTYPTELSLEAFEPPYFGGVSPRIVSEGWGPVGYGARNLRVIFDAVTGLMGSVEVVVMAPAFATHAFGMNQRMVGLRVERVVPVGPPFHYEAMVWGPPTPEIAPPGYYLLFVVHGGVPSHGVWVRFQL